jgi:hypothetical protein
MVDSRLQLAFFVLWSPAVGAILTRWQCGGLRVLVTIPLVITGGLALMFNQARPLIGWQGTANIFQQSRTELRFANVRWAFDGYTQAGAVLKASGCHAIGVIIDSHDPEYDVWAVLAPPNSGVHLEHLDVAPPLDQYEPVNFQPCAIFCTYCSPERGIDYGLPYVQKLSGLTLFLPAKK